MTVILTQNNRYWSSSAPIRSEDWRMMCHYWYVNSRNHIIFNTVNSEQNVMDIVWLIFESNASILKKSLQI
jgi:hypothetical protein